MDTATNNEAEDLEQHGDYSIKSARTVDQVKLSNLIHRSPLLNRGAYGLNTESRAQSSYQKRQDIN